MNLRPTTAPAPATDGKRPVREHADLLAGGGREHVEITVPRTEIKGRMRLASRAEVSAIIAKARTHFRELGMPTEPSTLAAAGLLSEWNNEIAVRHLAVAVRDPKDESRPLASIDEWRDCDDDQIATVWNQYQDLADRVDPLSDDSRLEPEERAAIERAAKKGEASSLMHFGSRKLALFAISSVAPPAS